MHDNKLISVFRKLWLIAIASAVLSCHKEGAIQSNMPDGLPEINATSEVTVQFMILDPDANPTTKVDTPENWGNETGSDGENTINNIYLFAVDYNPESGEETVEDVVKVDLVPGDFTPNGVRAGHTFKLSSGTKRFYVGANMTEEHVSAFKNKTAMKADTYESALTMVMNNYNTKDGNGTNILMISAPAIEEATSKSDIDISEKKYLYITAKLKRLVSKVMVVADYDGTESDPDIRSGEAIPYIRKENLGFYFDFQFILNNTNRAITIQETFNENFAEGEPRFNIDPNWKLSSIVEKDSDGLIRYKSMWDITANFTNWDTDGLKERLESTGNWWCSGVPSSSSALNGKGLYCLENTVFDDFSDKAALSKQEKTNAAFLATTHIYLKARFAPMTIHGDKDNSSHTTDDRISHLYWQTDKDGKNRYTFYIHKTSRQFFTYTGVNRWITNNNAQWSDFEEYSGGWVYFRTFFEEGGKDDTDKEITYEGINYWGIRRNDYCILTIKDIENWGESAPGEAFIKVRSKTVPWRNRGNSIIEITPE